MVNFKTYEKGTGKEGLKLAQICEEVAQEKGVNVIVSPQIPDLFRISSQVEIPVFSQHMDPIVYGSHTGSILPEGVKEAGASGCLINHSERRLKLADIEFCVKKLRKMEMTSIVCTNNIGVTKAAAALSPDFVAIEPPELIGSGIPVSEAQPEAVTNAVKAVKEINPQVKTLCGAGISKGEDLQKALELGTKGVLLASGIVKAEHPKKALLNLISPLI